VLARTRGEHPVDDAVERPLRLLPVVKVRRAVELGGQLRVGVDDSDGCQPRRVWQQRLGSPMPVLLLPVLVLLALLDLVLLAHGLLRFVVDLR
jgi:hypothetical protein